MDARQIGTDQTRYWVVIDNMRGMPRDGNGGRLLADDPAGEVVQMQVSTWWKSSFDTQQNTYVNVQNENYIYIAIRRPINHLKQEQLYQTAALNAERKSKWCN